MIRDVPLIGSIPNIYLLELFSSQMIKDLFNYQKKISNSLFLKLNNSNLDYENFKKFKLPRIGELLKISHNKINKKIIICQGADVLNQVLKIKHKIDLLENVSIFSGVWLNKIKIKDLTKLNNKKVILFQSSFDFGGFDTFLSKKILENSIKLKKFRSVSINELPKCGQNDEILNHYNLSANKILDIIKNSRMKIRNILIVGYKGLIGKHLVNFYKKDKNVKLICVDKSKNFDLTDKNLVLSF